MAAYKIVYDPAVRTYFAKLSPQSKAAVKKLIEQIAACPEMGDCVESIPGARYMKSYDVSKQEFDHGIRVVYITFDDLGLLAVYDMGDHTDSARNAGQSVYPDERRVVRLAAA